MYFAESKKKKKTHIANTREITFKNQKKTLINIDVAQRAKINKIYIQLIYVELIIILLLFYIY